MLCRLALTMTLFPLAIADLFVGQADCFVEGKNPSRVTISAMELLDVNKRLGR